MAKSELEVVTDAIRSESKMWDRLGGQMGSIHNHVETLRIGNRVKAGVFQVIFSAYEDAINQISDRCQEGEKRMSGIADTLVKNANAYDSNEEDVKDSVDGAY